MHWENLTNGRKIKLKDLLEKNKTALVNISDCVVAQHISAQIIYLFIQNIGYFLNF